MTRLNLTHSKLPWHLDRVEEWKRGTRIAPITVDLALTRACNFHCTYCYGQLQQNPGKSWSREMIVQTFNDFADIGVKAVSLVSDGESTLNEHWHFALEYGHRVGLDMALGTSGWHPNVCAAVTYCTYLRFNVSAASRRAYCKLHGVDGMMYDSVLDHIRRSVYVQPRKANCTIGVQMVLLPDYGDEILPMVHLCRGLGVDYLQIKHCSDDEEGSLGIDYREYKPLFPILEEAESMSDERFQVIVKWEKLKAGRRRCYSRCLAPPFHLQISGSGLVAPCGMFFHPKYEKYHIGNLHETGFKELWEGERYWLIMRELASGKFDAQTMCGCLCLQDASNIWLNEYVTRPMVVPAGLAPMHVNFI